MLKTPVKLHKCGTANTVHHIVQYLQQRVTISSVLKRSTLLLAPQIVYLPRQLPVNTELLEVGGSRWGQRKR